MDMLTDALAWVIPVLLAVTLHEAAHGWMAGRFGDDTARILGRVTFNPLKHIDRFGTIILPGLLLLANSPFLFGYAKPVPVDFARLRPARLGLFMVAIAGVLVNLALALGSGLLLHIDHWVTPEQAPFLFTNLYRSIAINCALIVFNLIPLLPLDGGRVVSALLPQPLRRLWQKSERLGLLLVILLVAVPPLFGVSLIEKLIGPPLDALLQGVLAITGNGSI